MVSFNPGGNIATITCSIWAQAQNANFHKKSYWDAKKQYSRSFFSPGCKNDSDYMEFLARLPGLRILARCQKLDCMALSAQGETFST